MPGVPSKGSFLQLIYRVNHKKFFTMKQDIQVIRDSIGKIVSMLTSRAIRVT